MNKELQKNIEIINLNFDKLKTDYNVKKIAIFGSTVRGDQTKKSDIDIIVEFNEIIGFFKFIRLEKYLGKILKKKVDLVTKKALKPVIKNNILKEAVYV